MLCGLQFWYAKTGFAVPTLPASVPLRAPKKWIKPQNVFRSASSPQLQGAAPDSPEYTLRERSCARTGARRCATGDTRLASAQGKEDTSRTSTLRSASESSAQAGARAVARAQASMAALKPGKRPENDLEKTGVVV